MINIAIDKNPNESNASILRRFSVRVRESGVLTRVRSLRYRTRTISDFVKKKQALKTHARRKEVAELIKLGKMSEKAPRHRR